MYCCDEASWRRRWGRRGLACLAIGVVMGAGFIIGGCASPLDRQKPWPGAVASDSSMRSVPRAEKTRVAQTQPRRDLSSLEPGDGPARYVSIAMRRNPAIRAAKRRVERLAARVPQAESLRDPKLQVAPIGDMTETAAGQTGLMTSVHQTLPLPGKRRARGRVAARDVGMARQQLGRARRRVAGDVRRAYWKYYRTVRSIEVTNKNRRLLRRLKQAAQAKYKAGTASQEDVLRAATELSSLDNKLATLRQQKQSAQALLNRLMDRPVTGALPEPGKVRFKKASYDRDKLLKQAGLAHPRIIKARERIEKFRAQRKLANLNRWPDLTVSVHYNAVEDEGLSPVATGEDAWWLGLGFNLPIWQTKLDAAEREAVQGRLEAAAELARARNTVAFHVHDALSRFRAQQDQVALFKSNILPQARQAVRASMSSYRAGKEPFLTVIDNWRRLLQFELAYHNALAQLEQAFADLKQQVGRHLRREPAAARTQPATQTDRESSAETHYE